MTSFKMICPNCHTGDFTTTQLIDHLLNAHPERNYDRPTATVVAECWTRVLENEKRGCVID